MDEIGEAVRDADAPVDNEQCARFPRNDRGNARRFIARHGDDVRETQRLGVFVWTGKYWERDDGDVAVKVKAQETADMMRSKEVRALEKAGEGEKEVEAFAKFASGSGNSNRLRNMVAEALPHLQLGLDDWNAQGNLFNVPNGTLEFGPRADDDVMVRLRAHRRSDYITCMGNVAYDPDATCPLFEKTLERVQPDKEMRQFIQRYFGASLVDSSGDQAMAIHHGGGANGKSTIADAIAEAMGSYAVTTDVSMLLHSDAKAAGGGPAPSLIKLAIGPRLVRAAEPELGMRLSESLIKQLTGGEPIEARDMFAKPIEFRPKFKMNLSTNSRPPVRGGDYGIWRRLLLVPWHVTIPKDERDGDLPEKLKAEAAGILNWLIAGWLDWHERGGLAPPAEVLEATEEYRQDSDPVGRFLTEWCVKKDDERVEANAFHHAFTVWCAREQVRVLALNLFGRRLTDRGIEKQASDGATYRKGYVLSDEALAAIAEAKQKALDAEADREQRRGKRGASDDYPGA